MDVLQCNVVEGEPPVLMVAGEIDFTSAEELRQVLETTLSADPAAEVDLSGVTFFDAAGIRVVLQVAVARNGHGPLTLVNVPKPVTRVLDLVRLGDLPSIDIRDECAPRDR